MSKLLLHARSSLPALRTLGRFDTVRTVPKANICTGLQEGSDQARLLWRYGIEGRPVHLLVTHREMRRVPTRQSVLHLATDGFPANSFVDLGKDVYASSPEYCFLQMSTQLDNVDLIRFGYELCSEYALDADLPGGFRQVQPLTDVKKIESFLRRLSGKRGATKATRALAYVQNNSKSPRETALAMVLCLPSRWGGYQLPKPEINHRIDVGIDIEGFSSRYIDLYWPSRRFGIEYESSLIHNDQKKMTLDSVREKILKEKQIQLLRVTKDELTNPLRFDLIVKLVSKALGKRLREYPPEIRRVRRSLAHRLFSTHTPLL